MSALHFRSRPYGSQDIGDARQPHCEGGRGHAVGLYARLLTRNHSPPHRQRSSCLWVAIFNGAHSWVCPSTRAHPLSLSMPFDCSPVARHSALIGRRPVPLGGWLFRLCGGTEGLLFGLSRLERVLQICHTFFAGGRAHS
jgi:hypothetical protein